MKIGEIRGNVGNKKQKISNRGHSVLCKPKAVTRKKDENCLCGSGNVESHDKDASKQLTIKKHVQDIMHQDRYWEYKCEEDGVLGLKDYLTGKTDKVEKKKKKSKTRWDY